MQFASLGSGSRGNSTLIETDGTAILVDCGFSMRETERRLQGLSREMQQITAILVTHEHGDHVRGVASLAKKYDIIDLNRLKRLPPANEVVDGNQNFMLNNCVFKSPLASM